MADTDLKQYRAFIEQILRKSGHLAMGKFGRIFAHKTKKDPHQVVTEVDLASEALLIEAIKQRFPEHAIIAEESGYHETKSPYTWIIDPIDGTSNYANGLPWFGVMVALLKDWKPIVAGIYLPVSDEMYTAALQEGASKNGNKLMIPGQKPLEQSLICFGLRSGGGEYNTYQARVLEKLAPLVLSIRCTNGAHDYAYTAEGKLALMINHENKIWDIAPISLIAQEAGYHVSDMEGSPLDLKVNKSTYMKDFSLYIAQPQLVTQVLTLLREV